MTTKATVLFYNEISGLVIAGSCVGTYGPSNHIVSPNYPQDYGNDIDCRWLISSPGIKNLTLKFLDLDIFGTLNVFEGVNIHGNLLNKYSYGSNYSSPIASSGSNMYLRFISDFRYKGFKIEVSGKYKHHYKKLAYFRS